MRRSALRRSRREKFIERFASIYTLAVMVLAVLTAAVPIILGYNPMEWIYRALVLLVISCPCALLISHLLPWCLRDDISRRKGYTGRRDPSSLRRWPQLTRYS